MATKPVTSTSVLSPVANKKRKEVLIKETPKFWLHVDADRDGAVDANPRDGEKWEWGKGKKGAIILVNNNDSDGDSKIDCDDQKVNAAADVQDIAQIEIRRTGSSPDAPFKLVLSVSATHKDCVRIFDTRTAAGLEIIGPTKGESHTFSDSSFTLKQLGIEAVRYAGTGFDGLVPVTATLFDGAKTEVSKHTVLMRVAPWIMFNHFDKPEQIYVVTTPDNTTFVAELSAAASSASVPLAKIDGSIWQDDRWMQDIMEFGFSELPGHPAMRSVLETPRGRGLRGFPKTLMSSKLGYTLPVTAPLGASSLNSGGNLECTPPFTSPSGVKYPFGRIYRCPFRARRPTDGLPQAFIEFLDSQLIQKPIDIDAGWLAVGHVDEIISFVPAPSKLGFKLLLASPSTGYQLLQVAPASSKMLVNREYIPGIKAEMSVGGFLTGGVSWGAFVMSAVAIRKFNDACQTSIDKAEAIFTKELGLTPADISHVPIIYLPQDVGTTLAPANAMTAGMVNMLVLGNKCIAPKPFGPMVSGKDLFEEHYEKSLSTSGMSLTFVDDWETYHLLLGEVHCGTNTLRVANPSKKWWEFKP